MFVAYIIGWVVLNQTKFGAHVYALGGNPAAAALNGIYVVTLLLFIRFIFIAPYFFSSRNLMNILISASLAGIVTAGYTVAILAGQIETSTQGVLAVATVTTALLSVRVLTPVMFAASWVAARSAGLGLPLAVNRLARSSRTYRIPLLLLILTLALAVFSASLAQTMKRQLAEELLYRFGADMSLTELGETIEIDPLGTSSNSTESANSDTDQQQSASAAGYTSWSFLPSPNTAAQQACRPSHALGNTKRSLTSPGGRLRAASSASIASTSPRSAFGAATSHTAALGS